MTTGSNDNFFIDEEKQTGCGTPLPTVDNEDADEEEGGTDSPGNI